MLDRGEFEKQRRQTGGCRRGIIKKKRMRVIVMKIKVEYSTMIVKNMEESVTFYRDVLGFQEGYHVDTPDGGHITIMESEGGASVELIENPNFEVGLYSVGTDVEDLDETIRHLEEKGYKPTGPVVPTTVGRMTFVLDPNGVRICLIEHSREYKEKYR